jgi:hypothetical protein
MHQPCLQSVVLRGMRPVCGPCCTSSNRNQPLAHGCMWAKGNRAHDAGHEQKSAGRILIHQVLLWLTSDTDPLLVARPPTHPSGQVLVPGEL